MILVGDFIPQRLQIKLPKTFSQQIVLANLEGPLCDDNLSISNKVGICLHTTKSEQLLKSISNFAFSLANNHMMDYGEKGLSQTRRTLFENKIPFAGAGKNLYDAQQPMILKEGGKRVAVFSCCERQFGMASEWTPGCAMLGGWLYEAIREIKGSGLADYVIVSCHAASEYSPWISPALHDFYHTLIDVGADCIHGHHSHVPQGYEVYKGRPIFYGLGNFIVDARMWDTNPDQLWSVVVEMLFDDTIEWHIQPYAVKFFADSQIIVAERIVEQTYTSKYLSIANHPFSSRDRLIGCWQETSVRLYHRIYEQSLRAPSVVLLRLSMRDILRKMMFIMKDLFNVITFCEHPTYRSIKYAKTLYNYFNCESHAQLISTALGVLTGVECDLRTSEIACFAEEIGLR